MRVNSPAGLRTLAPFGPKIRKSVRAQPDGLSLHENLSRGVKKVVNEQVAPAMQARAAQTQAARAEQQFAQAQADQDAIVARYPELRECVKDQVVFLSGGSRTVPISEIPVTVTPTQADAVVARLR
jgi:hypothetical protein